MKSMTGFGYGEFQDESLHLTVEMKSYNNRYLDLYINLPSWLSPLEPELRQWIQARGVSRGRIELNVRVRELKEDVQVVLDQGMIAACVAGLKEVTAAAGISDSLQLSDIMAFDGVVKTEKKRDPFSLWTRHKGLFDRVMDDFLGERAREGEKLREDITQCLNTLEKDVLFIENNVPGIESKIKENFQERFKEVLGDRIDEDRILSELGVLLVKYDINEEIVRLKAHVQNFTETLGKEEACGKKLDFICQELNREINTVGSKSPLLEINSRVVEMKNILEKIREQARNVE